MVVVPLLGIGGLALVGAAPAAWLTQLKADVRAALVLPVGAAIIACCSTFTLLGVPVRVIGLALAVAGAVAIVVSRRRIWMLASKLVVPAAVGLVALSFASVPAVSSRSWDAASGGNGDLYFWASQSRAFLDGPAAAPSTKYPDRDMYEWVTERHYPFGVGFSLTLLSLATARAPDAIYSALAALINVVLALTVFALARLALRWTPTRAAIAALLVGGNAFLLFATFFGWQAQLLLTSFSLLSLAGTYAALERGPVPAFVLLGGLGAAAAICTYGVAFAPFFVLGAVVILAYRAIHSDHDSRRRVNRSITAVALLTLAVAFVPIARALVVTGSQAGFFSKAFVCGSCQVGLPSESLGLVPRLGEAERASSGWSLLSLAVATPLFALGFAGARRETARAILVWASAAALTSIVLLGMFGPNPYLSMKVAGYAAPLLTLTALAGRRPQALRLIPRISWFTIASVAGVLFLASTGVAEFRAVQLDLHSGAMAGLSEAAKRIPPHARVEIDVRDAWRQAWALYYLRDRQLVVRHPQYFMSNTVATAQKSSTGPVQFVLRKHAVGRVLWRGARLVLSSTDRNPSSPDAPP
jgi:hypothetical protein